MSSRVLAYLEREHRRLEDTICDLERRPVPDRLAITALKKQKLAVKEQIAQWAREGAAAA